MLSRLSTQRWCFFRERRLKAATVSVRSRAFPLLFACLLVGGCAGLYRRPLPAKAAGFERVAAAGPILVGVAETDVTPLTPQYLSGFGMNRVSTGVHLPLKARAFVLQRGELKIAIVGLDNLGLHREDVDWIKTGIGGFANGCVFVAASHTHAAPDLIGFWGRYLLTSGRDRDYLAFVRARVSEAVAEAARKVQPVRLSRGEARMPPRGLVKNSNFRELIDPRVHVLHATTVEGKPVGTLLHLACHPEVMRRSNSRLSADFVGDLCDRWLTMGLGPAVFVNGALGAMITPDGWPRDEDGIERVGSGLFEVARKALADARPVAEGEIVVRRRDVYLPLESFPLSIGRLTMTIPREMYGRSIRSTVGYLQIGDLEMVAVPGEIEPGLAERIRKVLMRPDLWVLGLVDDEVGYLMAEVDARDLHFSYERMMSPGATSGELVLQALCGAGRLR